MSFCLSKCSVAIAAAMVSTINSTDDANRFSARAAQEGFTNISDLIAQDAVKQALAIQKRLNAVMGNDVAAAEIFPQATATIAPSASVSTATAPVTNTASEATKNAQSAGAPGLSTFTNEDSPLVPAATATAQGTAPGVSAPSAETNDTPLPPVTGATAQVDTTSTTTTMAIASDVKLDSKGLPWDGRIHASSKAFLAKGGAWKPKRGADPALVAQVEAELRAVMSIPAAAPAESVAAPPPTPAAGGEVFAQAAPATTAAREWDFPTLIREITAQGLGGSEALAGVLASFEIPNLPVLATRKDLIPQVATALGL